MTAISAPLRVDFGGGWLDVPRFARPKSWIVNCTISPVVTLENWPYKAQGGLGGSAAWSIINGKDAFKEELSTAGWQDPAVILETGLCVWRSGPRPVLEAKFNPDWLAGLMAIRWTGKTHDTKSLCDMPRNYDMISSAGMAAYAAAQLSCSLYPYGDVALNELSRAIHLSHLAQQAEGMAKIPYGKFEIAAKYCGSGWGGYTFHLFRGRDFRDAFVAEDPEAMAVEPFMSAV